MGSAGDMMDCSSDGPSLLEAAGVDAESGRQTGGEEIGTVTGHWSVKGRADGTSGRCIIAAAGVVMSVDSCLNPTSAPGDLTGGKTSSTGESVKPNPHV